MTRNANASSHRRSPLWYWRHFDIEIKFLCVFLVVNTTLAIIAFANR